MVGDFHVSTDAGICVATDSVEIWWPLEPELALTRATSPFGAECNASAARYNMDYCDPALAGPKYGVPKYFCWSGGGDMNMVPPWLLPEGAMPRVVHRGVWAAAQGPNFPFHQDTDVSNPVTRYNTRAGITGLHGPSTLWPRGVTHPPSHYQPQEIRQVVHSLQGSCALVQNPNLPVLCWEHGSTPRYASVNGRRWGDRVLWASIGYQELFSPPQWFSTSRVLGVTAGANFFCAWTDNATARVACWGGTWTATPRGSSATNISRPSNRYQSSSYAGRHYEPPTHTRYMPDFADANVLSVSAQGYQLCATTDSASFPITCWGQYNDGRGGQYGEQRVPDGVNVAGAVVASSPAATGRFCAITACTGNGALQVGESSGRLAARPQRANGVLSLSRCSNAPGLAAHITDLNCLLVGTQATQAARVTPAALAGTASTRRHLRSLMHRGPLSGATTASPDPSASSRTQRHAMARV